MSDKYKLVEYDKIEISGHTLYRIRALRHIYPSKGLKVSPGELGGYVGGYGNLSQGGECWISEKAKVYMEARVSGKSLVSRWSDVFGYSKIGESAFLESCKVYAHSKIRGSSEVKESKIYGYSLIEGKSKVLRSEVYGNVRVHSSVYVTEARIGAWREKHGYADLKEKYSVCDGRSLHNAIVATAEADYRLDLSESKKG